MSECTRNFDRPMAKLLGVSRGDATPPEAKRNREKVWNFRKRALGLGAILVLVVACHGRAPQIEPPRPGTTEGLILVDSPRVFARERLVRDREAQKQWLENQLDRTDLDFSAFQGVTRTSSFQRRSTRIGVDATAAGIFESPSANADLGPGEPDPAFADPPELLPPSQESPAFGDRPIDQFRDRLAYREEVRQELLDTGLDDAHDLAGNTLYRFAFDTTVLPGQDTGAWGLVRVRVSDPNPICDAPERPLETSEIALLHRLAADTASALHQAFEADVVLLASAFLLDGRDLLGTMRSDPLIGGLAMGERQTSQPLVSTYASSPDSRTAQDAAEAKARSTMRGHYLDVLETTGLDTLVSIGEEDPATSRAMLFAPKVIDLAETRERLCLLSPNLAAPEIDAYAVTPRESVERLADSASARTEQQSALSLAIGAGTVGLDGAFEYLNALENQRQGIRRQPVTVGFSSRDQGISDMGWILGPRFAPRYGASGFDYRHRPTQVSLSAVVSLPGWWTKVRFDVEVCWITEAFGTEDQPPCQEAGSAAAGGGLDGRTSFDVRLPGDPRELVRLLVPRTRRPFPYFDDPGPGLEIGRREHLVIFGENLWRNPQVFLGTQKADGLEILPDMNGVVATFDPVLAPAGLKPDAEVGTAKARIWTIEGEAVVGDVVLYRPD